MSKFWFFWHKTESNVDVGGMTPEKAKIYLEQIKKELREKKIPQSSVDPGIFGWSHVVGYGLPPPEVKQTKVEKKDEFKMPNWLQAPKIKVSRSKIIQPLEGPDLHLK